MEFANCWSDGEVVVYLNSIVLGTARKDEGKQEVKFQYNEKDTLRIEEEWGIIALYSLKLSCDNGKGTECCQIRLSKSNKLHISPCWV